MQKEVSLMAGCHFKLILEPGKKKGLLSVLAELETLEEEFPDVDEGLGALDPVKA